MPHASARTPESPDQPLTLQGYRNSRWTTLMLLCWWGVPFVISTPWWAKYTHPTPAEWATRLLTPLVVLGVAYPFYRLSRRTTVLDEQGIVHQGMFRTQRVRWADLQRIDTRTTGRGKGPVPFQGGWITLKTADTSLRFGMGFVGLDDLALRLKRGLVHTGKTDLIDVHRLFEVFAHGRYYRQQLARFRRLVPSTVVVFVATVLLFVLFSRGATWSSVAILAFLLASHLAATWALPHLALELLHARHFREGCDPETGQCPQRDLPHERRLARIAHVVGGLLVGGTVLAAHVRLQLL